MGCRVPIAAYTVRLYNIVKVLGRMTIKCVHELESHLLCGGLHTQLWECSQVTERLQQYAEANWLQCHWLLWVHPHSDASCITYDHD